MSPDQSRQPLSGVRVVEMAQGVAGPYAGKLLADYGADVIKIEPPAGDSTRHTGPFGTDGPDPEQSAPFLHLNTNKRSIVADLASTDGVDLVADLAAGADLFIESHLPGELDAVGLDADRLRARNPRLMITRVTSFGQDGPYAGYRGEEIVHYAVGGPMSATGLADRAPLRMGGDIGQYQCGTISAYASLAALLLGDGDAAGVDIDVSNVETQVGSIDRRMTYLLYYAYTHRNAPRPEGRRLSPLPGGVYPTGDGHVQISTMPAWVPRMLTTLGDPDFAARYDDPAWILDADLPEAGDAALLTWSIMRERQSAMIEAQGNGWPVTAVNHPVDLLDDPHFAERDFFAEITHPRAGTIRQAGAPARMSDGWALRRPAPLLDEHRDEILADVEANRADLDRSAGVTAVPTTATELPLSGVRVLDMTVVWSGPYTTTLLGDLGADVIRIDNPAIFPSVTRGLLPRPPAEMVEDLGPIFGGYPEIDPGERPWNRVALFTAHARSKRCVTLDLRKQLGRETFLRLVDEADVLVENNAVELMDKLGLGWDDLHARNPELIMIRMPSVGIAGPYREFLGFGVNFEALCGLGALRGYPDVDHSETDPVFHMDAASGSGAAFATLAALHRRRRTGVGEMVELSQAENMMNHIGELLIDADRTGVVHERIGNRHATRAPQGVYRCNGDDHWIAVTIGSDDEWRGLAETLGHPEWAEDARFATNQGRRDHHDELDQLIEVATTSRDADELFHQLQSVGVPAGPVLTETQCYADPHLRARDMFRENGSADLGRHEYARQPFRWNGPDLAWGEIPLMGGDNEAVYRDLLGLTDDEWQALVDDGHIHDGYVGPDGTPI